MQKSASIRWRVAALFVAGAFPAVGFAASETFRSGQSFHGQPGDPASATRVVDLSKTSRVSVAYGETVVFRGDAGQQFAWTFNGLDRRQVNLATIAPKDFVKAKPATAYVGRNPANRG